MVDSNLDLTLNDLMHRAGAGDGGSTNNEYWQSVLRARLNRDLTLELTRFIDTVKAESVATGSLTRMLLWTNLAIAIGTFIMAIATVVLAIKTH